MKIILCDGLEFGVFFLTAWGHEILNDLDNIINYL